MTSDITDTEAITIDGVALSPEYQVVLAVDIRELDLSVQTRSVLHNAEIQYMGDLVKWDEMSLRRLPNCGTKTIDELHALAAAYGLSLGRKLIGWARPEHQDSQREELPFQTLADLDETTRIRLLLRPDELNISVRATNALEKLGVEFVGDLTQKTVAQLLHLRNCGHTTVAEIELMLSQFGLQLGMALAGWDQAAARKRREALDTEKNSAILATCRQLSNVPRGTCLEEELDGIVRAVSKTKSDVGQRNVSITKEFLGWTGRGQRTLESVGQDYRMTRERVRQISTRDIKKIKKTSFETPWLHRAIETARKLAPATADRLAVGIQSEGIAKEPFDPTGLQSACECLGKDFGLGVVQIRRTRFYVRSENLDSVGAFFRLCRRQTSSHGCVNFEAACDELRIGESERNNFRTIAVMENLCEWLDEEQRWLFALGVPRNRMVNLISKVLSVSPELRLTELRRALSRSRRLAAVPPISVLGKFVERFGLASIDGDKLKGAKDFSGTIEAGGNEELLVSILRQNGPVLAWDRLRELCVAAGMNPVTFGIYLSVSPVIARVARGIYSLVGTDVPPGLVEEIASQVEAARAPFEWGWTARGTLWCAIRPLGAALAFGAVTIPKFVGDLAGGEWRVRLGGQFADGAVKCSATFLWGLRKHLVNAGAESDDVCILEFDLSAHSVNLTVGGEELIDLWHSGDIEHDVVDPTEAEDPMEVEAASL